MKERIIHSNISVPADDQSAKITQPLYKHRSRKLFKMLFESHPS